MPGIRGKPLTKRQRGFFGAELARAQAGQKRSTDLPASELRDILRKPKRRTMRKRSR